MKLKIICLTLLLIQVKLDYAAIIPQHDNHRETRSVHMRAYSPFRRSSSSNDLKTSLKDESFSLRRKNSYNDGITSSRRYLPTKPDRLALLQSGGGGGQRLGELLGLATSGLTAISGLFGALNSMLGPLTALLGGGARLAMGANDYDDKNEQLDILDLLNFIRKMNLYDDIEEANDDPPQMFDDDVRFEKFRESLILVSKLLADQDTDKQR